MLHRDEVVMKNHKFVSPDEWHEFCTYLLTQNRYVLNKKWQDFIETVLFTAKKREHLLKSGSVLFRARIGSDEREYEDVRGRYRIDINPLPPSEIEAPPMGKALEGRINPKGISYLYLANNIETAISEVRPWLKQEITVGRFSLCKDIAVVDASKDKHSRHILSEKKIERPSEEWEPYVWRDINRSFSIPVRVGEEHTYYVTTQYLSECFKNAGYEGIVYKSSLPEEGYNVALFDPKVVRLLGAQLFDIESITYKYKESASPYFLQSAEQEPGDTLNSCPNFVMVE